MAARLLFLNSDARIIDQIRKGDEGGLVELYRSNKRPITAFITRNNGSADDAEDLLQEALIVVWERIRTGKFELAAKLDTFVYATVKNMWRRRLARKRREVPGEIDPDTLPTSSPSALDDLIESEQAEIVRDALETLGEPCRTILMLFYWEELSMEEIAARLGFANPETAKSKKYQCKRALEGLLRQAAADGN
jgi:RNA polymerase sigma factor (sigma-70 family)